MVAIADKFGKASISTGYATATTVKVARTAGESVLSTYDLSKFAPDTPVFFVTYKKTTDPTTNVVSITSQTSWKALVNPDNNTLTNLTLAPGYTDIGNDIGDFVECIPTSFWGNSLVEGLFVSMNPDGTLKTSAVNTALGITGVTPPDWTVVPTIPTVLSNAGQKETVLRFAGADYSGIFGYGTKVSVARTGTTPTTSMAFDPAFSQYARNTAPANIQFTTTFTLEALVYIDRMTGGNQYIMSRIDAAGNNGWGMRVNAQGQLGLFAGTGGSARSYNTYTSVPTRKWTHLAITMDMAAGTCLTFIDGISVPNSNAGSAPTSITQAGNLEFGAYNASNFLAGKIASGRLWSVVRTPAQIADNYGMETPLTTTGLIGHWKGNGSWNDSAGTNNLTAMGSPVAVNNFASHAYSAVEYAYSHKAVYDAVNNRTDVTLFAGSGFIPNQTLGTVRYSNMESPVGFPTQKNKWFLSATCKTNALIYPPTTGVNYEMNALRLHYPTGSWIPSLNLHPQNERTTAGNAETWILHSDASQSGALSMSDLVGNLHDTQNAGFLVIHQIYMKNDIPVDITTPGFKYINMRTGYGGQQSIGLRGDRIPCIHQIVPSYLAG